MDISKYKLWTELDWSDQFKKGSFLKRLKAAQAHLKEIRVGQKP